MDLNLENKKDVEDFLHFDVRSSSTKVVIWKICDYFNMHRTADQLDSPSFCFQDAVWCLRIYPKPSSGDGGDDYIGFMLVRLTTRVPYHKFKVILKEKYFEEKSFELEFDKEHEENGDMEFSLKCVFDNLTLICQMSSCRSPTVEVSAPADFLMLDTKDLGGLRKNFKKLLLNGDGHDVILKVKDKEFRAHQNILRARSTVFESMLSHDMIERNSGVIDIPDCDPGSFEQFLLYLYSGRVETLDADNMLPLYYIADKYDKGYLKERCRHFIEISLSSNNVPEVIQLALNHDDAELLKQATNYFVKEVNSVMRTVKWQSFVTKNPIQANELFIKAAETWNKARA